jgi:hypothetical protein
VADVLTFYQERIANEGYLRTATERRSVLEMARVIGYGLNHGVATGTYLSFTVEEASGVPGTPLLGLQEGMGLAELPGRYKYQQEEGLQADERTGAYCKAKAP